MCVGIFFFLYTYTYINVKKGEMQNSLTLALHNFIFVPNKIHCHYTAI